MENGAKLTKKQKKVIDKLEEYDYDEKLTKVAADLGMSPSALDKIINRIEEKGIVIRAKLQEKKKGLTKKQKEVLDKLEEYEYDVKLTKLASDVQTTPNSLNNIINRMEEKGIEVRAKLQEKKEEKLKREEEEKRKNEINGIKLSKRQKEVVDKLEEYKYDMKLTKVAADLQMPLSSLVKIINRIEKKGFEIRAKLQERKEEKRKEEQKKRNKKEKNKKVKTVKLSIEENLSLEIYEEKGYYSSKIKNILKKFSAYDFIQEDAIRVSKLIKNRNQIKNLWDDITKSENISYNNIRILIDELLQNPKEDRKNAIDFVISYEEVLLNRGVQRVEEPIYQLINKHKVQLNKEQCNRLISLLDIYEKRIKQQEDEELEL